MDKIKARDTVKALSIKQPWAWLICAGYKDVENRNTTRINPLREGENEEADLLL